MSDYLDREGVNFLWDRVKGLIESNQSILTYSDQDYQNIRNFDPKADSIGKFAHFKNVSFASDPDKQLLASFDDTLVFYQFLEEEYHGSGTLKILDVQDGSIYRIMTSWSYDEDEDGNDISTYKFYSIKTDINFHIPVVSHKTIASIDEFKTFFGEDESGVAFCKNVTFQKADYLDEMFKLDNTLVEFQTLVDNDQSKYVRIVDTANHSYYAFRYEETIVPDVIKWSSVVYGNGYFVAIANMDDKTNTVVYSSDGTNWTEMEIPYEMPEASSSPVQDSEYRYIAYANGVFLIVAESGRYISYGNTAYTVKTFYWTGETWGEGELQADQHIRHVWSVNDTMFYVYVGQLLFSSSDGYEWELLYDTGMGSFSNVTDIAYGNEVCVAVGDYGRAAYSTDVSTWTSVNLPINGYFRSIAYGEGKFVACAPENDKFVYSTDGQNWFATSDVIGSNYQSISYGDGRFLAITGSSSNHASDKIISSTDGINWSTYSDTIPGSYWMDIACGNDSNFVAVSYKGNLGLYGSDSDDISQTALRNNTILKLFEPYTKGAFPSGNTMQIPIIKNVTISSISSFEAVMKSGNVYYLDGVSIEAYDNSAYVQKGVYYVEDDYDQWEGDSYTLYPFANNILYYKIWLGNNDRIYLSREKKSTITSISNDAIDEIFANLGGES